MGVGDRLLSEEMELLQNSKKQGQLRGLKIAFFSFISCLFSVIRVCSECSSQRLLVSFLFRFVGLLFLILKLVSNHMHCNTSLCPFVN